MNIVVMVNSSPAGSTLSSTALRFVSACVDAGHRVSAVYFRGDGVYNLIEGDMSDDSLPSTKAAWNEVADRHDVELLLCSSDLARRIPGHLLDGSGFAAAGLARWWELASESDRMVSF